MTGARAGIFGLALSALLACSRPTSEGGRETAMTGPTLGYGAAMVDVGRRFELLGRAASGRRFELAEYQLGELEEVFVQALPRAVPPREGHPELLPELARAFAATTVADLRRSLAARDAKELDAGFARTATACNRCHQASGHGFIEVPTTPGRSIPNLDPLPADAP